MTLPSEISLVEIDYQTRQRTERTVQLTYTDAEVNEDAIRDQARQALAANRAFLTDQNVTNAEAVAQVRALTQQVNKLIRFVLRDFDGTD